MILVFCWISGAGAAVADQISDLNRRIQELEAERDAYESQAQAAGQQSKTLKSEIARMNANISAIVAKVRSLEANIERTDLEISGTEENIGEAERLMRVHQDALGRYLRAFSEFDDVSVAAVLLQAKRVSDFFDHLNNLTRTQEQLQATIASIHELRGELDERKEELQDQQENLERLKTLQEIDQRSLTSTKKQKDVLLKDTQGQESKFQKLAERTGADINRLREQIYYLQKAGISVEDAVQFARLAAIGAGIRPAFLLALLEVESRLGQNVGTGNWRDDMYQCYIRLGTIHYPNRRDYYLGRAETEKSAFMAIIGKLGLNPDSVKVSREPKYGCGGAMGPAQFIPSTWLSYEAEISRITGNQPVSPWNTYDAFTAAAVKLARGGATSQDRYGEDRAARAYIGGSPTCSKSICSSYANTVLRKAAEIAQNL